MRLGGAGLIVLVLLAGCADRASDPGDDVGTASAVEDNAAAPNGQALVAFEETNATEQGTGGLEHSHDLWMGRDRVVLIEGRFATAPAATEVALRMPPGAFVYEGTAVVEVTLSDPERLACVPLADAQGSVCNDRVAPVADPAGGPPGLRLLYRDAVSAEWTDAGAIVWGQTFSIPIDDPRRVDMPHATYSLWGFRVVPGDLPASSYAFQASIVAVRNAGEEIAMWPGHPNFYAEGHVREVLRKEVTTRFDVTQREPLYLPPERLISWGTRALHIYANITTLRSSAPGVEPDKWFLHGHNASEIGIVLDAPTRQTRELSWTMPVDDVGMDSPYADGSRWGFWLRGANHIDEMAASGKSIDCPQVCDYEVTYSLTILATDLPLPDPPAP